jgi:lipopolysaccharide export system permease protein
MSRPFFTTHLFRYLASRLLIALAITYGAFFAIIYTVDVIEMSRRFSGQASASFASIILLSLYRIPSIMGDMTLFMVMLATIGTFTTLERRRELVVIRAMGLSPWQYLQSGLIMTGLLGIIFTTLYSPMAAHSKKRAEILEIAWTQNVKKSSHSLWFEDETPQGHIIIHGNGFEQKTASLLQPRFFLFNRQEAFQARYTAEKASLDEGKWVLTHTQAFSISGQPQVYERLELPTSLTPQRLAITVQRTPESLSFWELSEMVEYGKKIGANSTPYELRRAKIVFQTPIFIAAFLIAAAFSLGYSRLAHPLWPILKAMGVGFLFYALIKMIEDMGMAGFINPWVAAMIMPLTGGIGATLLLIKKEDG